MASFYFIFLFCVFTLLASIGEHQVIAFSSAINVTKQFHFPDFSASNNSRILHDVKLLGSAKFSEEKGALQIPDDSSDIRHRAGRGIYSFPIRMLDPETQTPASFQSTFSFQFINYSSAEQDDSYGGSGFTFIIVPDEFTVGRPGPWLAMLNDACQDNYKAVAIEFDTRMNPDFGDPNDNHIGINLGTIKSSKTINVSDVGVNFKDGFVHRAWITYDGPGKRMDIRLGSANQEDYPSKPIFSESVDLSPFLNEYMFVGFSASTGNHTQIHNILSWNFTSTSQASLRFPSSNTCEGNILLRSSSATPSTNGSSKFEPSRSFLIFTGVVALALAVVLGFYFISIRKRNPEKSIVPRPPNKPRRFSFSEISSATRSFNEIEVLGSDSRGVYYCGKLPNGIRVAVKRFSSQFLSSYGSDHKRRLLKEIKSISQFRHPNLIPIRGWCPDRQETMVVYDFFPNGSLDKWLFDGNVLPWTRRFKIIKDVADGLSFLHSKQLAHKNLKCSSVFLDVNYRAILGDFGFVLLESESRQFESTVCRGVDVFEFGIFVLEVIAGRRRVEEENVKPEAKDLLDYAWNLHEIDEKVKVVDRRMGSLINMEQAIRVLEVGLLCTLNENKGRPCMEQVVEFLNMEIAIPKLPKNRPVALFPYSSANTGLCNTYSCTTLKLSHDIRDAFTG
ncbi:L-type lectin-domain containing receptor kinase VIII.1-like [Neltuma alba]|uniref:L-type lectin-domain containing receptor kinase VIII.1-like n=1 Tax=Neltuma alba TaxID=207710 RepID=UPI0010A316C5|nr:L-type lectin-domain containing receptor kinase VIII.1-like [Prosopis alba]